MGCENREVPQDVACSLGPSFSCKSLLINEHTKMLVLLSRAPLLPLQRSGFVLCYRALTPDWPVAVGNGHCSVGMKWVAFSVRSAWVLVLAVNVSSAEVCQACLAVILGHWFVTLDAQRTTWVSFAFVLFWAITEIQSRVVPQSTLVLSLNHLIGEMSLEYSNIHWN